MAELTASAGLPRPEIEARYDQVTVRFRCADYVPSQQDESDLTELQYTTLKLLHQSDRDLALREIRALVKPQPSKRRLRRDLATLKAKSFVKSTGRGRGARWKPL